MKLLPIPQCSSKILGFFMFITLPWQTLMGATLIPVTNCTVDGLSAPCGPGNSNTADILFFYNDGLGSSYINISVSAGAAAGLHDNLSATAAINLKFYAETAGPVRPGIAKFTVGTDIEGSFEGAGASARASIEGLPSCEGPFCLVSDDLTPFTLGVPFLIDLSAFALAEIPAGEPPAGAGGTAGFELSLWEFAEDGSLVPVNILGPVAVPEPNQFGAVLFAALTCFVSSLRRRWRLGARRAP